MSDLQHAYDAAVNLWSTKPGDGWRVMGSRCRHCMAVLGAGLKLSALRPSHGTKLLTHLQGAGLSADSVKAYYGAFTRMVKLAGVSVETWPKAPTPPRRKKRDPFPDDKFAQVVARLGVLYPDTADLALLVRHSGMRPDREAMNPEAWGRVVDDEAEGFTSIEITGKGEHEREVLILDADTRRLVQDSKRLDAMRAPSYRTHTRRWAAEVERAGVDTRLPTLHSLRHAYGTELLNKSGGNIELARQLLGHADPKTTTTYMEDMGAAGAAKRLKRETKG